jgi:predicted SAM-dependent methyltransferase
MRATVRFLRKITGGGIDHLLRFGGKIKTKIDINRVLGKNGEIKLEIGAGVKKGKNGWITLDIGYWADLIWDLRNGVPFPDGSVNKIYSSHLFEHLSYHEINGLLNECKRVLKKDGVFSICVPNARLYIDAYSTKNESFWKSQPSYYAPAYNATTRIDIVNYIAYMAGEHKYMFDEENLLHILSSAGFKNVRLRDLDPEIDDAARQYESIYAEGIKS